MSLKERVESILKNHANEEQNYELAKSLRHAEQLADQYSDVKPIPYNVPMERFAGLPYIVKQ